jgi:hypothetical protein
MQRTDVLLTIDTEFSAGGFWADPESKPVGPRAVDLEIDGRSHGLGFLLDTFRRSSVTATFYVEALNVLCFGDEPMGRVAREIRDAGQDVQLHLHPMWMGFENSEDPRGAMPGDSMAGRDKAFLKRVFDVAEGAFERWGLARPVAVRNGNLQTDRTVYEVMGERGLRLASHIGLAVSRPPEPELHLCSGRHRIEGVLEVPVLSYREGSADGRLKSLTITGASFQETVHLLESAHARGLGQVVILTHAHEFVKARDVQFRNIRPHGVNQRRLTRLCEYLDRNRDRFDTPGMANRAERWLAAPEESDDPGLTVPFWPALKRKVQNRLCDKIWWY